MKRSSTKNINSIVDLQAPKHPLCIGFDPDVAQLDPFVQKQFDSTPIESFLIRWYQATIDKIASAGTPIKMQSAFFEQFGPAGMSALRDIMQDAKRRKMHVILDAKRGDISSTMTAYGRAAFDLYQADSLTILPWMGTDSLKALVPWLKNGRRIYIVWISSNKSGQDIQLCPAPLQRRPIAKVVQDAFIKLAKKENVLDQIGWVLGATNLSKKTLEFLPKRPQHLLLPGIGAQGATFNEKTSLLLRKHPNAIFPISRGLMAAGGDVDISSWSDYSNVVEKKWLHFYKNWAESKSKI